MSQIPISFGGESSSGLGQLVAYRYDPSSGNYFLPVAIHAFCTPVYETTQFAMGEVDWIETPKAHIIKVDVPGQKKEQVKLEVVQEGGVLLISGERREEEEEENSYVCHRMERSFGNFHRSFNLPEGANMDLIKASMADGVLTVVVPKKIKSE